VGQEPSEIAREIAATRARLTESVDALAERIAPRNVARRTAESAKEKILAVLQRGRALY
jgi:hypothetical protein